MKKIRKLKPVNQQPLTAKFYSWSKTQQQAIHALSNSNFAPDLAVTLTFTECPFGGNINTYNYQQINDQYRKCDEKIKKLMARLNQEYHGKKWYKKMKRNKQEVIQVYIVIEISKNNHFHYHLAFEIPKTEPRNPNENFKEHIKNHWGCIGFRKPCFGSKQQIDFQNIYNNGWIEYITKDLHKDDGAGMSEYSNFS
jgi:hypothetical protein